MMQPGAYSEPYHTSRMEPNLYSEPFQTSKIHIPNM